MSKRRYRVTEKDGEKRAHNDLNRAVAKAKNGATIRDRWTGSRYTVRKP